MAECGGGVLLECWGRVHPFCGPAFHLMIFCDSLRLLGLVPVNRV